MEITVEELKKGPYQLIDIREVEEIEAEPYEKSVSIHMPMSSFDSSKIHPDTLHVLFCKSGRRTAYLATKLREQGLLNVFSLIDGIDALNRLN